MVRSLAFGIALVLAAGTVAAAQTTEDQQACQDDAFRVCQQTIPDRERTFQCMIANKDALSAACRTAIARYLPPDPPPPQKAAARHTKKKHAPASLSPTAAR